MSMNSKDDFLIPPLAYLSSVSDPTYIVYSDTIEKIDEDHIKTLNVNEIYQKALTLNKNYRMFSFIFNDEKYHMGMIPNSNRQESEYKYLIARNKYESEYVSIISLSINNIYEAINMILIREVHAS